MLDSILDAIGAQGTGRAIQAAQTAHRLELISFWGLGEGARVLEIGCGQGDTTAALAQVVGDGGFVHGIDIAPDTYGAPTTLKQARDHLMASPLGRRMRIDFETDFLSPLFCPAAEYDAVVLSHCSWYFASREVLLSMFKKARMLAKTLCFGEWDIRARRPEQIPHLYAALIQAQAFCFDEQSAANIRTLFAPTDLLAIAAEAGWAVRDTASLYSEKLQDGRWEVGMVLDDPEAFSELPAMPEKMRALQRSLIRELGAVDPTEIRPLNVFAFVAE